MAELLTLFLFSSGILFCILRQIDVIFAFLPGLLYFFIYCLWKGFSCRSIASMMLRGIKNIQNIIITLMLIGMLTAVWRSCGAIAYMVYHGLHIVSPSYFALCVFLLCSFISFLLGSSFGTAGTVGVLCMTMGQTIGIDPLLTGGAVLSGAFFGDRCSPVSSSALLIAQLTQTNIYNNVILMMKSSIIPFFATCIMYLIHAKNIENSAQIFQNAASFPQAFVLSPLVLIPVIIILFFSFLHLDIRLTMIVSILTGSFLCVFLQHIPLNKLLYFLIFGYKSTSTNSFVQLLSGGGLISMLRVTLIVGISASYLGIFCDTPLLSGIEKMVMRLSETISPFAAILTTSVFINAISCNQSLSSMLTYQLSKTIIPDKNKLALTLENTVIIISAWIPWNISVAVPLATIGAKPASIFYAYYLFFIPLWGLLCSFFQTNKSKLIADK